MLRERERVVQIQMRWTPNERRIVDALQLSVLFWVGLLQRAITQTVTSTSRSLSSLFLFFFFTNPLLKTARMHLLSCSFKRSSANASTVDSCICFKSLTFHFYLCSDRRLSLIKYQLLQPVCVGSEGGGVWEKSPPLLWVSPVVNVFIIRPVWKAWFKEDKLMTAISHLFSIKHSIFSSDNGAFSSFFFDQLTHLSLDSNVCAISCLFFVSFLSSVMSVETLE